MRYKTNHPAEQLGSPNTYKLPYGNSTSTQRKRILSYLEKNHRISTMEAREILGILHPGGRIMELRKKGYRIDTHWIEAFDANGGTHKVGLYVYQGKPGGQYGTR
jgi:hypothetical protein